MSSLRITNYRWYWSGTVAGFTAMQMQTLAQPWLVYDMTNSPLALGIVQGAWGIPLVVLSLVGGVITDRVDKRKLLIVSQSLVGLITAVVATLIVTHAIQLWHLVVVALISGSIFAFYMPGRQAIVPELVGEDELMNAIALNSAGMNLTRIGAPALAGVLVPFIGISGVYFIMLACYLMAAASLFMIRSQVATDIRPHRPFRRDLVAGLSYVRHSPDIVTLLLLAFAPVIFGMPYQALLVVFARDVLRVSTSGLGILMTATGVGALGGSLTIAFLGSFKRKGALLIALSLALGVALVLFAISNSFYLSLLFLLIVGASGTGFMTVNNSLVLGSVAPEMRGRVMSIYMMTFGLMPLGTLPAGAIAQVWGAPVAVGGGGAILFMFTLLILLVRTNVLRLE